LAQRFSNQRQQVTALRAARDAVCARHVHRTRPKCVFPGRTIYRSLALLCPTILISMLAVFTIGQRSLQVHYRQGNIVSLAES
jgi:hypothetical protein